MFGWLGNKLIQSNVNRYKKEAEAFLHFLQAAEKEELEHMTFWASKGAMEFMALYDCDLYTPFPSLERHPGLDMALF